LVKGISITKYCDEEQLSPRQRLELCLPVCQALQHAHQKGVIHRDIKPSNVLVAQYDDEAVPKIIDFGLAKAISHRLTEKTLFTEYGRIVGTIDYMSPEQARFNQLDVDTRTDVYAMGVLLYELLTGETPFDKKRLRAAAFDELLRIIREEEPPAPSVRLSSNASLPTIANQRRTESKKLTQLVRGELDWIVMKALEKDRHRRYETIHGLRLDIQRYLDAEPVLAGPPSASYRLRKILVRHKGRVAAAALIVIALLSLTAASVAAFKNREVIDERNDARSARDAEQRQRHAAEHIQYVSRVILADMYWEDGNEALARSMLSGCPVKDKDWEWYYLYRKFAESADHARAPTGAAGNSDNVPIDTVISSAGGGCVVVGDADGLVSLYGADDAGTPRVLAHQNGPLAAVAVSSDGAFAAAASGTADSSEIVVCSTSRHQHELSLVIDLQVADLTFSPDARYLAAFGTHAESGVVVWKLTERNGAPWVVPVDRPVRRVAFSPDGLHLAVVKAGLPKQSDAITIHQLPGGQPVRTLDLGGHLVDTSDVRRGSALAYSPDGLFLLVGEQSNISVWNPETGECLSELRGHTDKIQSLQFNPSESRLVSAADDGTIKVWDWTPNSRVSRDKAPPQGQFHPSNRKWSDVNDLPLLTLVTSSPTCVAFSNTGALLVSANRRGEVQTWDGTPQFDLP